MQFRLFLPWLCLPWLCLLFLFSGCDNPSDPAATAASTPVPPPATAPLTTPAETPTQFNIGNRSYLFDVSDHSIEELESLLKRAQEISQLDSASYKDLEIVMILHGPDIDWFTQQNYDRNRQLVDLAAKLDAFDIIDMKICETTMAKRGLSREDIPSFIEPVPYAPDEMKRLLETGHINL